MISELRKRGKNETIFQVYSRFQKAKRNKSHCTFYFYYSERLL